VSYAPKYCLNVL